MAETRVALVTGSRKGIGQFLSHHLVKGGYQVIGCSRNPVEWKLDGYEHIRADISHEQEVIGLLAEIRRRLGRLDVVINNAGVASMNHLLLTPGATVERIVATNFVGTALVCREGAKVMAPARRGRIVNLSTVAVPLSLAGEAVYAASKAAVESLTRVLAHELGGWNITVNCVGPTPIETDLTAGLSREQLDAVVKRLAIKRLGRFEDVAHVIDFLIHPASDCVSGQVIYLGGPQ